MKAPHQDPLVVSAMVSGLFIKRLLVDEGSLVNINALEVYQALGKSIDGVKRLAILLS